MMSLTFQHILMVHELVSKKAQKHITHILSTSKQQPYDECNQNLRKWFNLGKEKNNNLKNLYTILKRKQP